jgi:hypothetical protein
VGHAGERYAPATFFSYQISKGLKQMSALYLRTVDKYHRSYGDFQWPNEVGATVTAPDWDPKPEGGNGLHGLKWGCGNIMCLSRDPNAVWQVVRAADKDAVDLDGKYKFKSCVIEYIGDRSGAIAYLLANGAVGKPVIYAHVTVGDNDTATVGRRGSAIAGKYGTAIAGPSGVAIAGEYGIAIAGDYGSAIAGDDGEATAGDYGTAITGEFGKATAGFDGSAIAGYAGIAIAGYCGVVRAGENGTIQINWIRDGRSLPVLAYVGENGIKPDTDYSLDENGNYFEVV